jgi:hypothetical protein
MILHSGKPSIAFIRSQHRAAYLPVGGYNLNVPADTHR